jgi:hypothetical protein
MGTPRDLVEFFGLPLLKISSHWPMDGWLGIKLIIQKSDGNPKGVTLGQISMAHLY